MILVIDCGSSKVPSIVECIDEFMDVESVKLDEFSTETRSKYKGIVISGAPILLTEIDATKYMEHFSWINSIETPVLGICFGHQIIGLNFGAKISKQKEDRDWNEIEILEEEEPLFDKFPKEFEMMEDHCEAISIPPHFIHLAVSDSCVNEAMKHQTKSIFGVQFHPEVSGNMGRLLFENFIKICEKEP